MLQKFKPISYIGFNTNGLQQFRAQIGTTHMLPFNVEMGCLECMSSDFHLRMRCIVKAMIMISPNITLLRKNGFMG